MVKDQPIFEKMEACIGGSLVFCVLQQFIHEMDRIGVLIDRGLPNTLFKSILSRAGDPMLAFSIEFVKPIVCHHSSTIKRP
jgi:hypothetical protein